VKRWLLRIFGSLLLGATVTIATTVALAFLAPHYPNAIVSQVSGLLSRSGCVRQYQQWHSDLLVRTPEVDDVALRMALPYAPVVALDESNDFIRSFCEDTQVRAARATGWPLRCLAWREYADGTVKRGIRCSSPVTLRLRENRTATFYGAAGQRIIPFAPLWPGFAINTVFYAVILWLLFALGGTPFALRRWRRTKRGLCPSCAYDLRATLANTCPECGAQKK